MTCYIPKPAVERAVTLSRAACAAYAALWGEFLIFASPVWAEGCAPLWPAPVWAVP